MSFQGCFLGIIACSLLVSSPASAQTTIEAGPLFGFYRPTGRFEAATATTPAYATALPVRPAELSGPAWGAEARIWVGARIGVQLQATAASSTISDVTRAAAGTRELTSARVSTVTAQALYNVSPTPNRYRLWLSAGGGVVRHEGTAYSDYGSPIDFAGVFGAGATVPIKGGLRATAGASASLYPFDVRVPADPALDAGTLQHGFQRDFLLHLGLSWSGPAAGK